jgi:hemerythrin superfamily protein
MAKAKKRAKAGGAKSAGARRRPARQQDAIDLLKADHRQVEEWFGQFESTRSDNRKQRLAGQICRALKVHTQIEEEIFYPAFLEATDEEDIHHEAEIEHEGAKRLIADIESAGPEDDYYDARVSVLSEMIKHHVNEEEKRDGMFAKARQAGMDLLGLGKHLKTRKAELMSESEDESEPSGRTSRGNEAQARA